MIPFNDLKAVFGPYKGDLSAISQSVIDSGWFVLGPNVESFQKNFASYVGATDCFGVANGTDALEIALRAVGVNIGDEVITVSNAGGYTTSACNSIGAVPVYFDIEDSLLGDISKIAEMITIKTRAIVATHLYGQAMDIASLKQVAGDIPIVEDCAEAHGARISTQRTGSMGDVGAFSFYPTKNLGALGDGGAITTSNPQYANNIKLLRQYGWSSKYNSSIPFGRNSRLDEMQAAFLNHMLESLEILNKQRVDICSQYRTAAPEMFSHLYNDERYVGHLAVARTANRDEFREFCSEKGISTDVHFPILDCDQVAMKSVTYRKGDLSVSEKSIQSIVSLPCYPNMAQSDVDIIVSALHQWNASGKIS